jgi:hypothetical protein
MRVLVTAKWHEQGDWKVDAKIFETTPNVPHEDMKVNVMDYILAHGPEVRWTIVELS